MMNTYTSPSTNLIPKHKLIIIYYVSFYIPITVEYLVLRCEGTLF